MKAARSAAAATERACRQRPAKAGLAGTVPARNKSSSVIADIIITAIITTQCKDDGLGNEAIRSVTT